MRPTTNLDEKYYKQTFYVNTMLLIVHVCLLLLFMYLHVTLMAYVNVLSVLLYAGLFSFYKRSLARYVAIVFIEVLLHMTLATMCIGWNGGFQLYSFCLVPCIFMCDYLARTDGRPTTHPIIVSGILTMIFLGTKAYCASYNAIYTLPDKGLYILLFTYNTIVSFMFLTLYIALSVNRILEKEKKLGEMAEADALTKLPNRYLMEEWLQEGYHSATEENVMAVAILDVDDFKNLNDVYGHNCGDLVLKTLAKQIASIAAKNIYVARWGGEEFLIMYTGREAYRQLKCILEQLRKDIESKVIQFHDQEIGVTVTIGITQRYSKDTSFYDIIRRADECMYEGKKIGKNRIIGRENCS